MDSIRASSLASINVDGGRLASRMVDSKTKRPLIRDCANASNWRSRFREQSRIKGLLESRAVIRCLKLWRVQVSTKRPGCHARFVPLSCHCHGRVTSARDAGTASLVGANRPPLKRLFRSSCKNPVRMRPLN